MDIKQKIEEEAEKHRSPEEYYNANGYALFIEGAHFAASLYEERIKELQDELRNEHDLLINALTAR